MDLETLYAFGTALLFAGILIILAAVLLLFLSSIRKGAKVKGGGVIMIGPIPIIFGTDIESIKTVMLLSIVLVTTLIILVVMLHFFAK